MSKSDVMCGSGNEQNNLEQIRREWKLKEVLIK